MIGTGPPWRPGQVRGRDFERRTPAYTRRPVRRSRRRQMSDAPRATSAHTEVMIFDHPPAALPTATLRSRESGTWIAATARGHARDAWHWFRPRTVPVIAAMFGFLAILASTQYLRRLATETPERLVVPSTSHGRGHLVIDHEGHHRWVQLAGSISAASQ